MDSVGAFKKTKKVASMLYQRRYFSQVESDPPRCDPCPPLMDPPCVHLLNPGR